MDTKTYLFILHHIIRIVIVFAEGGDLFIIWERKTNLGATINGIKEQRHGLKSTMESACLF